MSAGVAAGQDIHSSRDHDFIFQKPNLIEFRAIGRTMSPGKSAAFASNYFFRFVSRDSEL
jgi:hypothetical protein